MSRHRHSRAFAAAFALCCLRAAALAQDADTVYRLHGSVVNGVTNAPIARALVQSADRRLAVMTDTEGRFSIDIHVPTRTADPTTAALRNQFRRYAQPLFLTVLKPGYIAPDQPTLIPLDETLSATDTRLKLMPTAAIAARISASGADYAANVRVLLLTRMVDDEGNRVWNPAGTHTTNARGEVRFSDLRPGEYTLMTADWPGPEALPQSRTAVTQRYPPTYSGDTASLGSAVKLRLHYGDTAQAEMHLHPATYYPVTIPVSSSSPSSFVNARITDTDPNAGFQFNYNQRQSALQGSLPNGHYTLLLSAGAPQPTFASVELNVAGAPVRTAPATLAPLAPVTVRVHTQFTTKTSQPELSDFSGLSSFSGALNVRAGQQRTAAQNNPVLQLMLRPADTRAGYGGGFTQPGPTPDELIFQNLQPGHYNVRPHVFRGYASSITSNGVDLLQHPLVISAGEPTPPIDVVVRDDTAILTGTVTSSITPLPQQIILVFLPQDAASRYTTNGAGPEGAIRIPDFTPGTYLAFAIRNLRRQLPYRDPDFLRRLDGKAVTITASAGQQVHADIPLLEDFDPDDN